MPNSNGFWNLYMGVLVQNLDYIEKNCFKTQQLRGLYASVCLDYVVTDLRASLRSPCLPTTAQTNQDQ